MNKILGTAQLARSYGAVTRRTSDLSEVDAIRLLQLAEIKGFHAIDTAPIYGTAEAIVGRSGVKLEVHTKLDPTRSVIDSVDSSLRLLKREVLDVVYLHDSTLIKDPNSSVISSLYELVGVKVKRIGVSVYDEAEFTIADADPRIEIIQVPFSIFDQRSKSFRSHKTTKTQAEVVARSIFLQGLILLHPSAYPEEHQRLIPHGKALNLVAEKHGLSLMEVAIGFAKFHDFYSNYVFGTDTEQDLLEINAVFDRVSLSSDIIGELELLRCDDFSAVDPRLWVR